jgi:hypothetical protein
MHAKRLWSLWQGLLLSCALGFTKVGQARFVQWATGLALNVEEHTITQSLIALDLPADWKALESFAEYGSWDLTALQQATAQAAAPADDQLFFGYTVWAGDDTKVHRASKDVLGTCTFHDYSARCPNRASTVRAHNWVLQGALRFHPDRPPTFLPTAAQLYFRQSQLPPAQRGAAIAFRTKCQIMVELARLSANAVPGKHLQVADGGYCKGSVLRPLLCPEADASGATPQRIEVITRLRLDACLHAPLPAQEGKRGRGRPRKWGQRLAAPGRGEQWQGPWRTTQVYVYGQRRQVRCKEVLCCWRALGHDVQVKAVLAYVEGYEKPFTLLSSATELEGWQVVVIFCARSREEDGIRDVKQRLGWEECRAWTRLPIERTTQAQLVTLTCLRLLQERLEQEAGDSWWLVPPWHPDKQRPSVLDVQRLLRQHSEELRGLLAGWLRQQINSQAHRGPTG